MNNVAEEKFVTADNTHKYVLCYLNTYFKSN